MQPPNLNVELEVARPDGTLFAPFSPMRLVRDHRFYTSPVLSEEKALQDNAKSEVQEPVWVEIYQNNDGKAEAVRNIC